MTMTDGDTHGTEAGGDPLEAAFAAARAAAAEPAPAALLARIEADARAALRPAPEPAALPPRPSVRGRWQDLMQLLGGWPGIGGLATASAAGVWLGLAAPSGLDGLGLPGTADIGGIAAETFADGLLAGGYFSTLEEG
ncbi:MAG: hypothetical protein MUE98_06100 [Rhodobacteraceae bacterium]|jgi:hypothetical protein|nr:hypothetical protein [Paracoccaceae bacterium]